MTGKHSAGPRPEHYPWCGAAIEWPWVVPTPADQVCCPLDTRNDQNRPCAS